MANILRLPQRSAAASAVRERIAKAACREQPMRSLVGKLHGMAMSSWRGRSGRRYVVDVETDLDLGVDLVDAVVVAVARDRSGEGRVLGAAAPERDQPPSVRVRWLASMRSSGASELHVHHLADTARERRDVAADLAPHA